MTEAERRPSPSRASSYRKGGRRSDLIVLERAFVRFVMFMCNGDDEKGERVSVGEQRPGL